MGLNMNESTAVVLAGGKSRRMGRNKALIPVDGQPLITRVVDQLKPHFCSIVVSAPDDGTYDFLGCRIIADNQPDQGPLMGIYSVLQDVDTPLAFVVACDIPDINLPVIDSLFEGIDTCDCVVPCYDNGFIEPLFAVYRTSLVTEIKRMLDCGQRRVMDLFERVSTTYLDVEEINGLMNLNTMDDLRKWKEKTI